MLGKVSLWKAIEMTKPPNFERRPAQLVEPGLEEPASDDSGIVDTVTAAAKGEDRPMEKTHPKAPPALVFLTFPLVLIAVLMIIAAFFWIFGGYFGGEEVVQ